MPAAVWLQAQWRHSLGIETRWDDMEAGSFIARLFQAPPQLFVTGWYADYPDPDNFLNACPMRRYTGWRDSTYDRLVAEAGQLMDQRLRLQRYRQAEEVLVEAAPIVPLTYGREHWLVQPEVKKLSASVIKWWFWKNVLIETDDEPPSPAGDR
jgi:oligopeptide transport system substrate-binding protein